MACTGGMVAMGPLTAVADIVPTGRARGDDHARVFLVRCDTTEPALTEQAEGASLRAAEQLAAERLLLKLEKK